MNRQEMLIKGIEVEVIVKADDWAPGVFAGSEGMPLTIKSIDLENRKLILKLPTLTITDDRVLK